MSPICPIVLISSARLNLSSIPIPQYHPQEPQIVSSSFCCFRRDLETLCRDLDLGYTADSVLPNDHRGRVTLPEFQKYFSRLPSSLIWTPGSSDRKLGQNKSQNCLAENMLLGKQSVIIHPQEHINRPKIILAQGLYTVHTMQFMYVGFGHGSNACKV